MRRTNFVDFECPQHSRAFENIFTRRKEVRIIAQMSFCLVEKKPFDFFLLLTVSRRMRRSGVSWNRRKTFHRPVVKDI